MDVQETPIIEPMSARIDDYNKEIKNRGQLQITVEIVNNMNSGQVIPGGVWVPAGTSRCKIWKRDLELLQREYVQPEEFAADWALAEKQFAKEKAAYFARAKEGYEEGSAELAERMKEAAALFPGSVVGTYCTLHAKTLDEAAPIKPFARVTVVKGSETAQPADLERTEAEERHAAGIADAMRGPVAADSGATAQAMAAMAASLAEVTKTLASMQQKSKG